MSVLDLLYPPRCFVCRGVLPLTEKNGICADCAAWGHFQKPISGSACEKCGAPISSGSACQACAAGRDGALGGNTALYLYEGAEREIILNLKYFFGPAMFDFIKAQIAPAAEKIKAAGADFIIPVPLYCKKQRAKGFNHAEIIARALSAAAGVPVLSGVLLRTKNTKKQSAGGLLQRRQNVEDAFEVCGGAVSGKICLLADDIFTSGATLSECARALLGRGAAAVYGFTFCVTQNIVN